MTANTHKHTRTPNQSHYANKKWAYTRNQHSKNKIGPKVHNKGKLLIEFGEKKEKKKSEITTKLNRLKDNSSEKKWFCALKWA